MSNPYYPPGFDMHLLDGPIDLDSLASKYPITYEFSKTPDGKRLTVFCDQEQVFNREYSNDEDVEAIGMPLATRAVEHYMEDRHLWSLQEFLDKDLN